MRAFKSVGLLRREVDFERIWYGDDSGKRKKDRLSAPPVGLRKLDPEFYIGL